MQTTTMIIIGLLTLSIIANIAFIVWMVKTEKRLKRFFQGKKATDLEETFHVLDARIASLEAAKATHDSILADHDGRIKKVSNLSHSLASTHFQMSAVIRVLLCHSSTKTATVSYSLLFTHAIV